MREVNDLRGGVSYLRPENAPHSIEMEQGLIGTLMLMAHAPEVDATFGKAIRMGGADLFYDPLHAEIFDRMQAKRREGQLVSPVTIKDAMAGQASSFDGVGGFGYLVRLAGVASPSSAAAYVDMLADLRWKRRLAGAISEAQAALASGDGASLISGRLEASLLALHETDNRNGPVSMMKAVSTAVQQTMAMVRGESTDAIKPGIAALERMVPAFYPGEMILLGGRPSMGKTGVALSIALNAARAGHGVCIASLEMNPEAMALRALSEATAQTGHSVSYSKMRKGEMTDYELDRLEAVAETTANLPIVFLPRQFADIGALYSGAQQANRKFTDGLKLLVVDYAQLLRSSAKTRYDQITEVSIALKNLAGQLNVPVLALSQLSRAVEQRDDKRPQLSDLRESGQLEQDADTVLFCYRDEYYLEREKPSPDDKLEAHEAWTGAMERARNRLEIIVAKQRQGEIGTAHVRFNPATNLIWEEGR
jgi:replicative DNA helicase